MEKRDTIKALDVLAHEKRLDIFRLLMEVGDEGIMVGIIGEKLGLPLTTLSFHLDKLKLASLIYSERRGRATLYYANYDRLVGSIQYPTETCCKNSDMACRIVIQEKPSD